MTTVESDSGVLAGDPRMLIDGELQLTAGGATFDVINPATEEVAGVATDGTTDDMARAVDAARRAFDTTEWSRDVEFRYRCLTQLHSALQRDQERLRRIVVTEVGCPVGVTWSHVESPIEEVEHWAEFGRSFQYLEDTGLHQTMGTSSRRLIHYDPVGVVGAITPWNVPFYLNVAETMPALMAGNTVVLKPAQLTPWAGSELGRIVAEETDIPAGVFNVVLSNANEVGAALSADPRVDMITFTGSTATGRAILAAGASTVKRTLLELGGKSAHVVLDDADLTKALPMAATMACIMSGQSCVLPSRILLPRSRYDEGLAILQATMEAFPIGDPWDPAVLQGPQISAGQREKVLGLIADGVASGARVLTGGGVPPQFERGYYVQPTLLADVDPDSRVAQEEIFGPVLSVIPYETEDEAVAIANNSIYGLSGEVSSADEERALAVAMRLRTGSATINGGMYFGLTSPFGGTKQSGLGRRNGAHGFQEYLEIKTLGLPA
ncbi:aldehyde dehydrogenase family protein [Cryptosporangium phraense]|uniref:Aldehyde dehydrogenase family protein n=1 Tax=Cryptosporangium phraense TaxID=2593070 RepID=A0A545AYY5_9ACTN|nr:aldehyde dehydrogenase family protein [Cryptosporangium phraense]TQS46543.1 aldehyde dehydrogenase family protein [Cryptosporangium phraense]